MPNRPNLPGHPVSEDQFMHSAKSRSKAASGILCWQGKWPCQWPLNVSGYWEESICHSQGYLGTTQILTAFLIIVIRESNRTMVNRRLGTIRVPCKIKQMMRLADELPPALNCGDLRWQGTSFTMSGVTSLVAFALQTLSCRYIWVAARLKMEEGTRPASTSLTTSPSQRGSLFMVWKLLGTGTIR